ncbi:MAG: NUDIX domain-containing protein [Erysipelotrichaceae bacterium]|nr:NUDIX domain-containing protein [Erysipelotrichaceae bacterium]MDD4642975.1 NUDIX domain-containing protein [Erysipelotrichaceae bacterium]
MKQERSCGAIIYSLDHQYNFLLLQHQAGHWAFAKGHMERNETPIITALREIEEETGLGVELDINFMVNTSYSPNPDVIKEVTYFLAYTKEIDVKIQVEEIRGYVWLNYKQARALLTYENDKKILDEANTYLATHVDNNLSYNKGDS